VEARPLAQDLALPIQKTMNSPPSELDGQIDLMATPGERERNLAIRSKVQRTSWVSQVNKILKTGVGFHVIQNWPSTSVALPPVFPPRDRMTIVASKKPTRTGL
jgi:hypothetical protein